MYRKNCKVESANHGTGKQAKIVFMKIFLKLEREKTHELDRYKGVKIVPIKKIGK